MKTKTLFIGILLLLSWTSALAQGGTTGPLTWKISNDTLIISGIGAMPDYKSLSTGSTAPWYNYRAIPTVVIENGVTSIGNLAFLDFRVLTSITIPNSITKIGLSAFNSCSSLTSIIIPNSVTDIGDYAFLGCSFISITNYNPVPVIINSNVFAYIDISACTLKVPMGSVFDYKNAEVWKEFNIVGIEVGIEPIEKDVVSIYPNPTNGKLKVES